MMSSAISLLTSVVPGLTRWVAVPAALVGGVYVGRAAGSGSVLQPAPWLRAAWTLAGDAQAHADGVIAILHVLLQRVAG